MAIEGMEDLRRMVAHMKVAMMSTRDEQGVIHSRPLWLLELDEEGRFWFFVSQRSDKIEEMEHEQGRLGLSFADLSRQDYVSVSGQGEIVRDPKRMKELWNPWVKAFFPRGLDDPELALLMVTMERAEYWDAPGSAAKRLYGMVKARVTGDTGALGDHGTVERRR